jgi:hypothetical protein
MKQPPVAHDTLDECCYKRHDSGKFVAVAGIPEYIPIKGQ